MMSTPVSVRMGTLKRVLMWENQVEKGKAESRAMLHARRDPAVLVPTITKYFGLLVRRW